MNYETIKHGNNQVTWKYENGVSFTVATVETHDGELVMKYSFDTFEDCENYFLEIFHVFRKIPVATKVIGKSLLIFNKNLANNE